MNTEYNNNVGLSLLRMLVVALHLVTMIFFCDRKFVFSYCLQMEPSLSESDLDVV